MSQEIWIDVPGFEGRYQASSEGKIRSVDRSITQIGRGGLPFTRQMKGKLLRPGRYCKSGHLSVVLGKGANGTPVHQLVMLAFHGPVPVHSEVRHKNGDPTDNRLENLVYGTRTQNIYDVIRLGRPWRKLTWDQATEIKNRLANGEKGSILAKEFGVSQTIVSGIKHRRIHRCELYQWT